MTQCNSIPSSCLHDDYSKMTAKVKNKNRSVLHKQICILNFCVLCIFQLLCGGVML